MGAGASVGVAGVPEEAPVSRSLPLQFEVVLPAADPVAALAQGVRADALGFDAVSLPDHYFQPKRFEEGVEGRADPFITLGALAQATKRVRLGQAVVCAPFHHPVQVARAITSLDRLSEGRAELGIGAGWYRREFQALGIPFLPAAQRRALLEESLEVICRYWSDERVHFRGKHFQIDDLPTDPRPLQRPRPPITVGGSAPALIAVAARFADAVNLIPPWLSPKRMDLQRALETSASELRAKAELVFAAAEAAGRDPEAIAIAVNLQVLVDEDPKRIDGVLAWAAERSGAPPELLRRSAMTLVGTPEECRDKLSELQESIGFQRVALGFLIPDQIDLFATEVLSSFRTER